MRAIAVLAESFVLSIAAIPAIVAAAVGYFLDFRAFGLCVASRACGAGSGERLGENVIVRPDVYIVADDLRANAIAWREEARLPVRAVVKADGYGWGVSALVDALDATVEGYYVSDADEFAAVRLLTSKPVATLGDVATEQLRPLLAEGGIPTISAIEGIDIAESWMRASGERTRVRIALRNATGWSGIRPDEVPAMASALKRTQLEVELSSHITDTSLGDQQLDEFLRARALLKSAGVAVVASDIASTAPLAAGMRGDCSHVRVGVGLFGARFGANVAVISALRVCAPIVARERARGQRTGYGLCRAPDDGYIAVLRCGYGDGFPILRDMHFGILAVGMQFTTFFSAEAFAGDRVTLIDRNTDIDELARASGIYPHQLVASLGNAARAARVANDPARSA